MRDQGNNPMKKILKKILWCMPVFIAGMFLFGCQSKKALSPEESIRSLKVFNSDITNLSSAGREQAAFIGLDFLLHQASSPLSIIYGMPGKFAKDSLKGIDAWKGKYAWNNDSRSFLVIDTAGGITILFPIDGDSSNNARFIMSPFNCQHAMNLSCFPDEFTALMENKGKTILNIGYKAEYEDDWPLKMQSDIRGDGYAGFIRVDRTREGDRGAITFNVSLVVKDSSIIEGTIKVEIGYNDKQFYSRVIEPDLRVFDVRIKGWLDYGKVDPTSREYVKSFNDNCHIAFYESGSGKKIGDFGLGMDKTGQLLEWVLYLSDGSKASLYENILVFKKFMDYKYPNRQPVN
jgi:hypothetical protein